MFRAGKTYGEIAETEGVSKRRIQDLVELAFLAPNYIRDVWRVTQPVGLTSKWAESHSTSPIWQDKRALFMAL